ncbi:hypothetical protein C8A01DRAFT_34688 [Parachaetomium inaequale]|uniref:Uncharacterized protein n=1 Tax=Parachaetomium inaequale TaxID=2588326 RepID=A0AAN6PI28_9PEZI|nr:hypothetical protein C8A01DRAFT_34688 [Parachaetomium inaequale]
MTSPENSPFPTDSANSPKNEPKPLLPNPPATWDLQAHLPQLERDGLKATQAHLIHALDHVGALLSARDYNWAVTGGLALFMHGFRDRARDTPDVDVVVEASTLDVLGALTDARIYRPPILEVVSSGRGRFYVLTGPEFGDLGVQERGVVEVGLMPTGLHFGVPTTLSGTTTIKTADTAAGPRTYGVLSVPQLVSAKLYALDLRDTERDLDDLEWLCLTFPHEFRDAADMLGDKELLMGFVTKYREKNLELQARAVRS